MTRSRSFALLALSAGCAKHGPEYPGEPMSVEQAPPSFDSRADYGAVAGVADGDRPSDAPAPPPPPPPPPPTSRPEPQVAEAAQPAARMVHYDGWANLRATRVRDVLTGIAAIATDAGGRVDRLSGSAITIRVPVEKFDAAWKLVLAQGDVIDQSVSAADVTDAFTDVDLRIRSLTVTRDRLVALLGRTEEVDEKVRLLQEIASVTEQLDQLQSQLRQLRSLADFATITVQVVAREAVAAGGIGGPTPAGMEWIAALSPFRRDIGAYDRRIALPVPDGLVALSTRGPFSAESPEGVVLWTGRLDNDPAADASFWVDAIVSRLGGQFASAEERDLGQWRCVELVDASEVPYTWDVCIRVDPADRKLLLGEVYYPSPEATERYRPAVEASFSGGES